MAEVTARKAVALLRDDGLVETVTGWGSFVMRDVAAATDELSVVRRSKKTPRQP